MNKLHQAFASLILLFVSATVADAAIVLMDDDFSSSPANITTASRFQSGKIDSGDWVIRSTDGPGWSLSGGKLTNPATTTNDDKGAHLLNTVSSSDTSLTNVTVSFDYTVGEGSTLYFYSSLFTGDYVASTNAARISRTGGRYFANSSSDDFNNHFTSALNLKDGGNPNGGTGTALISIPGSSSTSGTFSQTYDISGYAGVSSVADVSHVLAVFTADTAAAGNGAISIDNFNMTATAVPEPSSFALMGGAFALFAAQRRRRRAKAAA